MNRIFLLSAACVLAAWQYAGAATYTVTRTADDLLTGSLRWAITQANSNPGYDVIAFNIATGGGNTFESSGGNSWALISVTSALPEITETVLIDGTTQGNTNTGAIAGQTVGVDAYTQPSINYPDVYIICGYTLPNAEASLTGNGLFINAPNVTIRGLCISGFGNTSTTQTTALAHADISVRYSATDRTMNTQIIGCFVSCTPRGAEPSPAVRRSRGGGILILGNNNTGRIEQNYVAYTGGYGIIFHGTVDNVSGATPNLASSEDWVIRDNQLITTGTGRSYTTANRAADAISLMSVTASQVLYNYVNDWEQFAIDLGHNTDNNTVSNNTVIGFNRTVPVSGGVTGAGAAPCGGMRSAFSSEGNTFFRNVIQNNGSTSMLAGIWTDRAYTTFAGGVQKNSNNITVSQNRISGNAGSGVVLSTNIGGGPSTSTLTGVTITQNSIYSNTGLGIDLEYTGTSGPVAVTTNDDGDVDAGVNDIMNFPMIDQVETDGTTVRVWGKAPAGSTLEFFVRDGGVNNHGGRALNYGEGMTFIGSGVEGSAADLFTGTGSYNLDGNTAVNNTNRFFFTFSFAGLLPTQQVTATATLSGNTSEFGPQSAVIDVLDCHLLQFTALRSGNTDHLQWKAICNERFRQFVVEHSTDGRAFSYAGTVQAKPGPPQDFAFSHPTTTTGKHYYRLRLVSADNNTRYSAIIHTNGSDNGQVLRVAENPFRHRLSFTINTLQPGEAKATLFNAGGAPVLSRQLALATGANAVEWAVGNLPSGPYTLVVENGSRRSSATLIKQ